MSNRRLTALGSSVALVLSLLGVVGGATAASATTPPTFEATDANALGTVSLYNASGALTSSGSTTSAFTGYYKASGPKVSGLASNLGFISICTPQDGVAPASWTTCNQVGAAQDYTTLQAGYPSGLTTPATNVVIAGAAGDVTVADQISLFPSASVANADVYQLRVYTSSLASTYYTADVHVTGTTWTQVYPAVATGTATTTTLAVSPVGTAQVGDQVTLTATLSPTGAAGSVQFFDGVTAIGSPVAVSSDSAQIQTSSLTKGSHNLSAQFTPTDSTVWLTSTSSTTSYSIVGIPTTTTLASSRTGKALPGSTTVLTAHVTPANQPGSVQFYDGATPLGLAVPVSAGTAVRTTGVLSLGAHSFQARFIPSSSSYATSSSALVALTIAKVASSTRAAVVSVKVAGRARKGLSVTVLAVGTVPAGRITVARLVGKKYVTVAIATLVRGKKVVVLPVLPRGTYTFRVTYGGSAQVLASAVAVRVKY